jgi:thiamine pyrophosphokinase
MNHVLVLVGGSIQATPRLRKAVADASVVIAADGGLHHAETLSLNVNLIVGDLDSVDARVLARYPRVPVESHPRTKDALDVELALDAALRYAPKRISVIGGLSGRFDQTLANLAIVAARHTPNLPLMIDDGIARAYPMAVGESRTLGFPPFALLSLQPLDAEVTVSLTGVRYPLKQETLLRAQGRGVSNVALGSVSATAHAGSVLLLAPGGSDPSA